MSRNGTFSPCLLFLVINYFILYCSTCEKNATLSHVLCVGKSFVLDCNCKTEVNRRWLYCSDTLYIGTRLQIPEFPGTLNLVGNYSLNISSVELANEGTYECFCDKISQNVLTIIVEAPPDLYVAAKVTHDKNGIYNFESGKSYSILCYGEEAKPPVNLTWLLNEAHVYPSNVDFSITDNQNGALSNGTVTRLTFQSDEKSGNITCVSNGQCNPKGQRTRISYQTYVVPHVSFTVSDWKNSHNVYVKEKQEFVVNCTAKAARPAANLTLHEDGKPVNNSKNTIFIHGDINLFDTSVTGIVYPTTEHITVTCTSRGEYGYDEEVITANISTYAIPTFKVTVNSKHIANGSRYYTRSGYAILVRCHAFGARPAVHLNWTITGDYSNTQDETSKDNTMQIEGESEISLHLLPRRGKVTITCVGSCHPGIPHQNYQIEIITEENDALIIVMAVALLTFLLVFIGVLIKTKGLKMGCRIASLNSTVDDLSERSSGEINEEMSNDGSCIHRCNVTLLSKLAGEGRMGYWKAVSSSSIIGDEKFIAKSISESAQLKDLYNFRDIAKQLMELPKHENIVDTIGISIEDVPYYIYQEFIEYGSLRNYMMRTYQQKRKSQLHGAETSLTIQKEVDTKLTITGFALDVSNGMCFLNQNNFCHPALNCTKVLLTKSLTCKLYDFVPESMARDKLDHILRKDHPPLAWLPPETIFLKHYTKQGDVWSLAVAIWEIYSLGDTPYAGMTVEEIEKEIRNEKVLAQPFSCPGSVRGLMLASWDTVPQNRPTFEHIAKKMKEVMSSLKQHTDPKSIPGGTDEPTYFTLDEMNGDNDYVPTQYVMKEVLKK